MTNKNSSDFSPSNLNSTLNNKYEIVYIVDQDVKNVENVKEKILKMLGGKVTKKVDLGFQKFAYPIKRKEKGYYFLLNLETTKAQILDFQKRVRLMKEIVRYLVINLDKEKHFRYRKVVKSPFESSVDSKFKMNSESSTSSQSTEKNILSKTPPAKDISPNHSTKKT